MLYEVITGTAIITASTQDGNHTATCEVTVTTPAGGSTIVIEAETFTAMGGTFNDGVVPLVITSYSIHYTKLYEMWMLQPIWWPITWINISPRKAMTMANACQPIGNVSTNPIWI